MATVETVKVMFVCLGNICRSPTAHGVFRKRVRDRGLADVITVDSCGTGDWHIGHSPDQRATVEARRRGIDIGDLRAMQIAQVHFYDCDYILAMDHQNLVDLKAMRPGDASAQLGLLLTFASGVAETEVPDPYYGGDQGFARVFDMIENACEGLLREIVRARIAQ